MSAATEELQPLDVVEVGAPRQRERRAKPEPLAYGGNGSKLFARPTPAPALTPRGAPQSRPINPDFLIRRLNVGDPFAREAFVEVVYTLAGKALRRFDDETRAIALEQTLDYLLGGGLARFKRELATFGTWASRILVSRAKDHLRKKRPVIVQDAIRVEDADGDVREQSLSAKPERHDSDGKPIIPGAAPSEPARDFELKQKLSIALAAVNDREREILFAIADGETPEEIAGRLRLSAGRVRAILAEARAKARAALA